MADLERKVLSTLTDLNVIADVHRRGLCAEAFETPINAQIFDWIIDYWQQNDKNLAPTRVVLEHEFPGVEFEDQVEESVDWLVDSLKRRLIVNKVQDQMRTAITKLRDDPDETVRELQRGLREALAETGTSPGGDVPQLWSAADLAPGMQPRWLAKNRLPRGAVSLLVGDEGIGKSLFWVYLASAITTGKPLLEFGVPARDPAHVVIVVTEDDWSTTVRPRLEVAGADLAMVRMICAEADGSGAPEFPRDLHLIYQADPTPALVVVDAWLDTVPAKFDVRNPQAARQALHPWREAAVTTDAAVLLLTHTNRVATANARDRYGATGELRKKARMTLFAQRDDDDNLVIGPDKANTAATAKASVFTIRPVQHFDATDDFDGMVPRLTYAGESDQTAQERLAQAYAAGRGLGVEDNPIMGWLASYLASGPRWSNDVYTSAQEAGFSVYQAKRAKTRIGVDAEKDGTTGAWFWRLPGQEGRPQQIPETKEDAV
ncbi:AAA family ATPase [Mycolicibacterium fluoranthenivorans]|uniref:AAA domain-containing protein n=1 Tax=Mycolicibacterium fluoranthenivorans TaxID=258505 RepID=A0A1G4W1B9_9MYCO|nr:AAA family ATPase [Mycolicibacterium fluoranthenivorans]SCX15184.1 AAA domain-containing protein [Mycolicibacterium fluoranthenivorans]